MKLANKTHYPANLFVISAPSGAGKTSLANALVNSITDLTLSVSHTTRAKRPNEIHGVNYFFTEISAFQDMIKQEAFLEYACVFGHHYGTARDSVTQQLSRGIDVLLEIDWQGAAQVRKLFPQAITLFILPPSRDVLRQRLEQRQQDQPNVIENRLSGATQEMQHYNEFDYLLVNDQFNETLQGLQNIIYAHRYALSIQSQKHAHLLDNLLSNR